MPSPIRDVDFITQLNEFAWNGSLCRFAEVGSEWLWIEKVRIFRLEMNIQPAGADVFPDGYRASFQGWDAMEEIRKDPELGAVDRELPYFRSILEEGSRLLVVASEGRIVCYGFLAFGRKRMYSTYFSMLPHEFFIMRCFTRPSHRGQGLYPKAVRHACSLMAREGFQTGYIDIATHNRSSLRGAQKAGVIPLGSWYVRLRILGRDVIFPRGELRDRFHDS
jgi:hypothetical protein